MKIFTYIFLFSIFLMSCSQKGRTKLNDQSVWTFSRYDDSERDNFRKIKVRFHDNGYAYEENTILKYPYRVFHSSNTFEFNRKMYNILEWKEKEIVLQNSVTEIVVVLRRE